MQSIVIFLKNGWKKTKSWYQHDRDAIWYAIGFALALWFFLLSENYAQVGYSWQKAWDQTETISIITTDNLSRRETMPNAILEEEKQLENEKMVKGGN